MKTKYIITLTLAMLIGAVSCDKGFEELNKNPLAIESLDPSYLFASAQPMGSDGWHYEACIVQQINLIITGQEAAGNHNIQKDNFVPTEWNRAYGALKTLTDILVRLEGTTTRTNLYNMTRILRAWNFMRLVDYYGDVPYTEAIKGYYTGNFFPKYDNQADIYEDIKKELVEATNALDDTKDLVKNDMYFQGNIARWKKLGNTLLLRLGMRYTKLDPDKAKSIVLQAIDPARGGVILTNAENVVIPYNNTQNNPINGLCRNTTKQNWHIAKPLVDFMYANNDPRMPYWICLYADPNNDNSTKTTTPAAQIGCPIGYDPTTISQAPGYPGMVGGLYKYSQMNRQVIGRGDNQGYLVTAAQTNLLLADATERGWISTGTTAQQYYETGIRLHLSMSDIYATTRGGASPITTAMQDAYLAEPNIAYKTAGTVNDRLEQINTQYWVASFLIWDEAWANFRRTAYPSTVVRNPYPGADPSVIATSDGFIHRMTYPVDEYNFNKAKVLEAAGNIGGDKLGTRVFWDIE